MDATDEIKQFKLSEKRRQERMEAMLQKYSFLSDTYAHGNYDATDGLFNLIDELFAQISNIVERDKVDFDILVVTQKCGLLRIYGHGGNDEIWTLIRDAEARSATVCAFCGAEGEAERYEKSPWSVPLCPVCAVTYSFDQYVEDMGDLI